MMKSIKRFLPIIVSLSLILLGCKTSKITKRYKKLSVTESNKPDEFIDVSAFSLDFNKISSNKTIFDLAERGQKELIEQTSNKTKSNADLYKQLSKPFIDSDKKTTDIIHTKFKKRLVISVENLNNDNGANRIEELKVKLDIPVKNRNKIEFFYWDKIVTEYQEIDLGKLTFSQTGSFSISPSIAKNKANEAGTNSSATGLPLSTSISSTLGEEVVLKKKFARISGSLSENQLSIIRNSAPLEDINGNIIIELTVIANNTGGKLFYEFENLFSDGKAVEHTGVKIKKLNYQFPDINVSDSEVNLSYEFSFRQVDKGAKTFSEADDVVVLVKGKKENSSTIQLLEEEDLEKDFWLIKLDKNVLSLKTEGLNAESIRFVSYSKAQNLINWLKASKNTSVGTYKLGLGLKDLEVSEIPKLKIEIEK